MVAPPPLPLLFAKPSIEPPNKKTTATIKLINTNVNLNASSINPTIKFASSNSLSNYHISSSEKNSEEDDEDEANEQGDDEVFATNSTNVKCSFKPTHRSNSHSSRNKTYFACNNNNVNVVNSSSVNQAWVMKNLPFFGEVMWSSKFPF